MTDPKSDVPYGTLDLLILKTLFRARFFARAKSAALAVE